MPGPADQVVVDKFGSVVAVDACDGERKPVEHAQDVNVGVVADRSGEHPAGVHVGEVHRAAELTLQRRNAVSEGVYLEETGLGFDFVTGLVDGDGVAQQASRPGCGPATDRGAGLDRGEVAADMDSSSARTSVLYLSHPWARDPSASIRSNQFLMDEARYCATQTTAGDPHGLQGPCGHQWEYLHGFVLRLSITATVAVARPDT